MIAVTLFLVGAAYLIGFAVGEERGKQLACTECYQAGQLDQVEVTKSRLGTIYAYRTRPRLTVHRGGR